MQDRFCGLGYRAVAWPTVTTLAMGDGPGLPHTVGHIFLNPLHQKCRRAEEVALRHSWCSTFPRPPRGDARQVLRTWISSSCLADSDHTRYGRRTWPTTYRRAHLPQPPAPKVPESRGSGSPALLVQHFPQAAQRRCKTGSADLDIEQLLGRQ